MGKQLNIASAYVEVEVSGNSIERFLNICRNKRIFFWDIQRKEYGFDAKIKKNDFLQIKEACRKTKTKARIKVKKGVGFILFKYRKHYSFLVGMLIALSFVNFCSRFVWDISFTGNSLHTESMLTKSINQLNIKRGMPVKDIDCNYIESSLRSAYDNITWVSAQISGTRLIIHIKENETAKESVNDHQRNIIASCDGTIYSIITRKGTPLVNKGDEVTKGQIIVSGIVDKHNDSGEITGYDYVAADADIMIDTQYDYQDKLQITHECKYYTGRKIKKYILGINDDDIECGISLKNFDNYDITTDIRPVIIADNFALPFCTGYKLYKEYEVRNEDYTKEEAEEILNNKLNDYLRKLMQNKVQIISNGVKMKKDGACFIMNGKIRVLTPEYEYMDITPEIIEENEKESKVDN